MRNMLKSKIHRARVTETNLEYEGSITIDQQLLEAADIIPYEEVHVLNVNNGARFSTYAIMGDAVDGPVTVRLMVPGDVYNYHTTTTIASSTTETDEEFKVSTETGKTPTFGTRRFLIGPDDWRFEQADNGTVYLLGERSEEVTSSTGPPVFIPSPIAVGQTFSYTLVLQNTDLTNVYTDTKQVVVTVSGVDEIDGATHYVVDYNYNTSRVFATGEVDFGGTMHFKVNPLVGLFTLMEETKEQSGDNLYTKSRQLTSKSF